MHKPVVTSFTHQQELGICRIYVHDGWGMTSIALLLNSSEYHIRRVLNEHKIPIRDRHELPTQLPNPPDFRVHGPWPLASTRLANHRKWAASVPRHRA